MLTFVLSQFAVTQTINNRYIQPSPQFNPQVTAAAGTTLAATPAPRKIRVVNECPFEVWIGGAGGYVKPQSCSTSADCTAPNKICGSDKLCGCATSADCGAGRVCVKGKSTDAYGKCSCANDSDCGPGRGCSLDYTPKKDHPQDRKCFWTLPQPRQGWWVVLAKGQKFFMFSDTATFDIPEASSKPQPNMDIRWSGGIFPRTGCAMNSGGNFVCETGDACGGVVCDPGKSGRPPATQVEFTLQNYDKDYYDLEVIDGVTLPMEMKPDPSGQYQAVPKDEMAEYWCGNPGGVTSTTGLSGCGWSLTPGSMNYPFVNPGGKACTKDSDCNAAANERCGLTVPAIAPAATKPPNWGKTTCGKFHGYWSAVSICGLNPDFGPPNTSLLDCNQAVPSANGSYGNLKNLYGCVVPSGTATQADPKCTDALCAAISCYNDASKDEPAHSTCCGCEQWPACKTPKDCQGSNTYWQTYSRTKIQFMKDACPTSYTYPYDDETSTFKCRTDPGAGAAPLPNKVSYVVTFCPGGKTGGMK